MMNSREKCYGCGACAYICKHKAILMDTNPEGFSYPIVCKGRCVSCGLCDNICPENDGCSPLKTFSGHIISNDILYKCASGGAFTAIASSFIKQKGVVFAAADDLSGRPAFEKITSVEELCKVQGSKYFQIDLTENIYEQIKSSLKETKVLFCGTPCQVAAVKKVFKRFSDRLYTLDLICGGVPSYKLVKQYRDYKEKVHKSKLVEHCFRAKDNPELHGYQTRISFADKSVVKSIGLSDEYIKLFASGITLRPSCYNCEFTGEYRVSDITIGDHWGINSDSKYYKDRGKGVSLFICNTVRGTEMINSTEDLDIAEVDFDEIKRYNRPLRAKPVKRFERKIALKIMDILPFKIASNLVCYRYNLKKIIRKLYG